MDDAFEMYDSCLRNWILFECLRKAFTHNLHRIFTLQPAGHPLVLGVFKEINETISSVTAGQGDQAKVWAPPEYHLVSYDDQAARFARRARRTMSRVSAPHGS